MRRNGGRVSGRPSSGRRTARLRAAPIAHGGATCLRSPARRPNRNLTPDTPARGPTRRRSRRRHRPSCGGRRDGRAGPGRCRVRAPRRRKCGCCRCRPTAVVRRPEWPRARQAGRPGSGPDEAEKRSRPAGFDPAAMARRKAALLAHEETQVRLAEGDDATETLLFHRADEPLGIRVEIGTLRRETDRLDTPAL